MSCGLRETQLRRQGQVNKIGEQNVHKKTAAREGAAVLFPAAQNASVIPAILRRIDVRGRVAGRGAQPLTLLAP